MRTAPPARPHSRLLRLSPLAASIALALAPAAAFSATLMVTDVGDNGGVNPVPFTGTGTLRQAIVDANANCYTDPAPVIQFGIDPAGPFVIALSAALPQFLCYSGP